MKLLSLKLENFRCFESCELDLNCEGLIGVSGPNGSGKSTLLEAVNYALYGRGRGAGTLKPERDGAGPKAKCKVELEFIHDDRHCRVVRGPRVELLEVDAEQRINGGGQEPLTKAVTELLGVGKKSFIMTFYARQSEVQALNSQDKEKELHHLLGIDQVRDACAAAGDAVREQKAVVRALQDGLPSVDELEEALGKAEEDAREKAPAVEAAKEAETKALKARNDAWKRLTEARTRAEEAFELDAKAAVSASELESALEARKTAEEGLDAAEKAAAEIEGLKEEAGRVEELAARERAYELELQTSQRADALREQRREAEAEAVEAADKLAAVEDQGPAIDSAVDQLADTREQLEQTTSRLLALPQELTAARAAATEAVRRVEAAEKAEALDEELESLLPLRDQATARTRKIASLEAESTQLATNTSEERAHLDHVREDGPDATCPRCKRSYGDDYEGILAEFESTLASKEAREGEIGTELKGLREEDVEVGPKLDRLQTAEAERAGLQLVDAQLDALEKAVSETAEKVQALEEDETKLNERRKELTGSVTELESKLSELRAGQAKRAELTSSRNEAEKARDLYARQLAEIGDAEYDEDAHQKAGEDLKEARAAADRTVELRAQAGQCELLEARLNAAIDKAERSGKRHEEAKQAAAAREPDKKAQKAAEEAHEVAVNTADAAATAHAEAKDQAVDEDRAVNAARAELKSAKRETGRLEKERAELLLDEVVAAALEAYRSDMQRQAVPSLAQETADLLRSVTRGRYSDVKISEGELEVIDRGEAHGLKRFSGGERDIANLCLRIGLSKVLARRSGTETGFIILDEVLGSQDPDRRSALLQALRELDQEFGQVFVVSHFEDFMEHCSLQISVDSVDGLSRARIVSA